MKITPVELSNKEFSKGISGYNKQEVDEYLKQVSMSYNDVYSENQVLEEKLESVKSKLEQFEKMESTMNSALILAQKTSDTTISTANEKAELIINKAKDEAKELISKTHKDLNKDEIEYNNKISKLKNDFEVKTAELTKKYDQLKEKLVREYEEKTANYKKKYDEEFQNATKLHEDNIANVKKESNLKIETYKKDCEDKLTIAKNEYEKTLQETSMRTEKLKNDYLSFRNMVGAYLKSQLDTFNNVPKEMEEIENVINSKMDKDIVNANSEKDVKNNYKLNPERDDEENKSSRFGK